MSGAPLGAPERGGRFHDVRSVCACICASGRCAEAVMQSHGATVYSFGCMRTQCAGVCGECTSFFLTARWRTSRERVYTGTRTVYTCGRCVGVYMTDCPVA
jgi:hypothetical protein